MAKAKNDVTMQRQVDEELELGLGLEGASARTAGAESDSVVFEGRISAEERRGREWFALKHAMRRMRSVYAKQESALAGKSLRLKLSVE